MVSPNPAGHGPSLALLAIFSLMLGFMTFVMLSLTLWPAVTHRFWPDIEEAGLVVPGGNIEVNLHKSTFKGYYSIENLKITVDGTPVQNFRVYGPGRINSIVVAHGEQVKSEFEPEQGGFSFLLSNDENFLGRKFFISYDLDFFYPVLLGNSRFYWQREHINGSFYRKCATADQIKSMNEAKIAVYSTIIFLSGIIFLVVLYLRKTYHLFEG